MCFQIKTKKVSRTKPPTYISKKVRSPVKTMQSPKSMYNRKQSPPKFKRIPTNPCETESFMSHSTFLPFKAVNNDPTELYGLSQFESMRRETFTIKGKALMEEKENVLDDSLEMRSDQLRGLAFEQLQFTPLKSFYYSEHAERKTAGLNEVSGTKLFSPLPRRQTTVPFVRVSPCKTENSMHENSFMPLRDVNWSLTNDPVEMKGLSPVENTRRDTFIVTGKALIEDKENVFDDSLEMKADSEPKEKLFVQNNNLKEMVPTEFSSSPHNLANLSAQTYIINRQNSTGDLTYTKDLSSCSIKTSIFSTSPSTQLRTERFSAKPAEMHDNKGKKRKHAATEEKTTIGKTSWSNKPFVTPKRLRTFVNKTQTNDTLITTSQIYCNDPFILAATNSLDPFMMVDLMYNPQWLEEQEQRFKKWLNALLTPPSELESDTVINVDVARLWRECHKKEVAVAPTKEVMSDKYHTSQRLNSLRIAALNLYQSPEIVMVLRKTMASVESGKLMIRKDRDIHLDVGMQSVIMSLLLSYNPLWLRIGLETIYGTAIPLKSNSDIVGLTHFLFTRFFKDPFLLNKYKTTLSIKYAVDIKKFVLKKYLALVYFLDQAKMRKLIKHDPCLFCKNAPVKESKEMLTKFCTEVIHATGDITKYLKRLQYTVQYQQTYINEYDYAVNNLGIDLRDGVRLTKVVEIILLEKNLTSCLRVPAISRLQKIHNVKTAFQALSKAGFVIMSDIEPKDIVDGHREKTLSFLWQILYKFEAPLLAKSVTTIQSWWRSLNIVIKRRIFARERETQNNAALKIQIWYRRLKLVKKIELLLPVVHEYLCYLKREKAAVKIQSCFRMYKQKKNYRKIRQSVILIQRIAKRYLANRKYRAVLLIQHHLRGLIVRRNYLRLKLAVAFVEQRYIAKKLMLQQYMWYKKIKTAAVFVQLRYRVKKQRREYLQKRNAAIHIQQWYRSVVFMREERKNYLKVLWAINVIQTRFRALKEMKVQKMQYQHLLRAVRNVQEKFKAKQAMRAAQKEYLRIKKAVIAIQRWFKARKLRENHLKLRNAALVVQRRFRANQAKRSYRHYKNAIIKIQRFYRSIIVMRQEKEKYQKTLWAISVVQTRFRATREMKLQKMYYNRLLIAVRNVQEQFRAKRAMQTAVIEYLSIKSATIKIQRWFRALQQRKKYLNLRNAVLVIQQRVRANKTMKETRNFYINCRNAVIKIQRWYRSLIIMRQERQSYQKTLWAITVVQTRFRATKQMKTQKIQYIQLLIAVRNVQERFRAKRAMQAARKWYLRIKNATIVIQRWYRAKEQRKSFLKVRNTALVLQKRFRARNEMIAAKNHYRRLKHSTVIIQRRFRANKVRRSYSSYRNAVIKIQRWYRSTIIMKQEKENFKKALWAITIIQARFRATREMKTQKMQYNQLLVTVRNLQEKFRAKRSMQIAKKNYLRVKNATIVLQRWFRARKQRENFLQLRNSALVLQKRFIANKMMKQQRSEYLFVRFTVLRLQRIFRGKIERKKFLALKHSVVIIQKYFRAWQSMRKERGYYLKLKLNVVVVQKRFRALKQMKQERLSFIALKNAVLCVETKYRAIRLMRRDYENYQRKRNAAVVIQRRYRALCAMQTEKKRFIAVKHAVVTIQKYYRMRIARRNYLHKLETIINIQSYARGFLVRLKHGDLSKPEVVVRAKQKRKEVAAAKRIQVIL